MRLHNWDRLLAEYVESCRQMPFEWGVHDCCLFPANAAKLITGIDYAAEFRGHYSTEIGAKRALLRYGQGDLASTLSHILGDPVPLLSLRRGDIALAHDGNSPAVTLMYANQFLHAHEQGIRSVRRDYIQLGWRIG